MGNIFWIDEVIKESRFIIVEDQDDLNYDTYENKENRDVFGYDNSDESFDGDNATKEDEKDDDEFGLGYYEEDSYNHYRSDEYIF